MSIINKYNDIFDYVNNSFKDNPSFYEKYNEFISAYISANSTDRLIIFSEYYPELTYFIDMMYTKYDFDNMLNVKEDSRFDLNINLEEAKVIMQISFRCRFFIICYLSEEYSLSVGQRKIFNSMLYKELMNKNIVEKLFSIIESIIMCTNPEKSGKKIWELFSYSQGYSYESHSLKLLNSIFYKAMPSLKPDNNPIAYIITVARMELEWMLKTHLTYVCIPTSIDILSSSQYVKNDILQTEVFYRVIVKNIFNDVAEEYKIYRDVYKNNSYSILTNIAQPLVMKIFNMSLKRLPLTNQCLINFYTHKFLSKYDNTLPRISNMLISATHIDKSKLDVIYPFEFREMIQEKIGCSRLGDYVQHLNKVTLKKMIINSLSNLYKYRFFDVIEKKYIEIDWKEFSLEYVDYIFKIVCGHYNDFIMEERKRINLNV